MSPFAGALEVALPALLRLVATLGEASLVGGAFILAVWALCRLLPSLPPAVRCGLWWLACLKLLVVLLWVSPLVLPVLPAPAAAVYGGAPAEASGASDGVLDGAGAVAAKEVSALGSLTWPGAGGALLGLLWCSGAALLAWRAGGELLGLRRVVRGSRGLVHGPVAQAFSRLLQRLPLRPVPGLRVSGQVPSPRTVGLMHPNVLLPEDGLGSLRPADVEMVLCHELAHVRRRDLWLGWVPALAQRLFFFHPLAALAAREYALAREAACDAEVLRLLGAAPRDYGHLLLRWGVAPGGEELATAGASSTFTHLKRRLEMLHESSLHLHRAAAPWWLAVAVACLGILPIELGARAAGAAPAPESDTSGYAWSWSSDDEAKVRWVYFNGKGGSTAHISWNESDQARKAAKELGEPLFWLEEDDQAYVIRDPGVLRQVQKILEPQMELGREQGLLGKQQRALGEEQRELGEKQRELGRRQAAAARGRGDGESQSEIGRQQAEIGRQQAELGQRQAKLGQQQGELGQRQREAAAKAQDELRELVEQARKKGLVEEDPS